MNQYQTLVEKYTGLPINALIRGFSGFTGRKATAQEAPKPERQGPTQDIYGQPGVGFFDRRSGRFLGKAPAAPTLPTPGAAPGMGVTPIVRQEDDQYRQLLSQYGALQKEKKFEEADKLGMQIWQQKYGKTPMGQPGGAVGTHNPLMDSMREMFPSRYGQPTPTTYAGEPNLGGDFALAANAVPAPWNEQGAKVSAPFTGVIPAQAAKTSGEGMPAFQTTGEQATEFLKDPNILRLLNK